MSIVKKVKSGGQNQIETQRKNRQSCLDCAGAVDGLQYLIYHGGSRTCVVVGGGGGFQNTPHSPAPSPSLRKGYSDDSYGYCLSCKIDGDMWLVALSMTSLNLSCLLLGHNRHISVCAAGQWQRQRAQNNYIDPSLLVPDELRS